MPYHHAVWLSHYLHANDVALWCHVTLLKWAIMEYTHPSLEQRRRVGRPSKKSKPTKAAMTRLFCPLLLITTVICEIFAAACSHPRSQQHECAVIYSPILDLGGCLLALYAVMALHAGAQVFRFIDNWQSHFDEQRLQERSCTMCCNVIWSKFIQSWPLQHPHWVLPNLTMSKLHNYETSLQVSRYKEKNGTGH